MAYRPQVGIVNQFGMESVRGTPVSAATRLTASSFQLSKEYTNDFFRRAGHLFPTAGVRHRAWTGGRLDGRLSYEEAHLWWDMYFGTGTSSSPATGATQRVYSVSSTPAGTWKTATGQWGDAVAAREVSYLALASYNRSYTGENISIGGDMIGKAMDTGATLDTVTTTLPEQLVSVADVHYFIDSAHGSIGGTEWTDVFDSTLSLPIHLAAAFAHGSATFSELVEVALDEARLTIHCADTAQSRAIESAMDTDQKPFRFLRINADGEVIASTTPYRDRVDLAVKLETCTEVPGLQNALGLEFVFRIMHSDAWGKAMAMTVINTQS